MAPGVARDLVAAPVRSSDYVGPWVGGIVNLSLILLEHPHLERGCTFPRLFPVMKNVALALYLSRSFRMFSVKLYGPSS